MMLSRRTLLKSLLGIPVVIGAGYLFAKPDYKSIVERAVYKKLGYLKLEPAGVKKFSSDFIIAYKKGTLKIISISIATQLSEYFSDYHSLIDRVKIFEDFAAKQYLLSSDYFVTKKNKHDTIKYRSISFIDPYQTPCSNPFAKFIT